MSYKRIEELKNICNTYNKGTNKALKGLKILKKFKIGGSSVNDISTILSNLQSTINSVSSNTINITTNVMGISTGVMKLINQSDMDQKLDEIKEFK